MYDYANDNSIPEESRRNMELPRIEHAVREILEAIGEDPDREGLQETPQRVARMYAEVFAGLHRDISKDIKTFHGEGNDEMILIGDIPFYSMCEHHLLPFHGKAHVVRVNDVDEVVRHPPALGKVRFRRADVHAPIDGDRVDG